MKHVCDRWIRSLDLRCSKKHDLLRPTWNEISCKYEQRVVLISYKVVNTRSIFQKRGWDLHYRFLDNPLV
ncbi:hypothetical protein ACS0TY_015851 [Phlomoides rotata]